jgi:hypothetical protein
VILLINVFPSIDASFQFRANEPTSVDISVDDEDEEMPELIADFFDYSQYSQYCCCCWARNCPPTLKAKL